MTDPSSNERCPMRGRHMSVLHRDACTVCGGFEKWWATNPEPWIDAKGLARLAWNAAHSQPVETPQSSLKRVIPEFFGKLYPQDASPNASLLGTWVRRAEVDALLVEIEQCRNGFKSLNGAHESLRQRFSKACERISQLESLQFETKSRHCGVEFEVEGETSRCSLATGHAGGHGRIDLIRSSVEPTADPCNCRPLPEPPNDTCPVHSPEETDCRHTTADPMNLSRCKKCGGPMPPEKASALPCPADERCLVAGCTRPAVTAGDGTLGALCEEHNGNVGLPG